MLKLVMMLACVSALSFSNLAKADDAAKPAAAASDEHKAEEHADHKHGKKCGHKAEKHGDHTDYEHDEGGKVHHHKKHGKHYDECEGPEASAKPAAAEKAAH